jgi:hypothetical protein
MTPKPVDWSAKLTRSLTLKNGDKLKPLGGRPSPGARASQTEVEDHALSNAMRLLLAAAETGSSAARKAATDQVTTVLRARAVY